MARWILCSTPAPTAVCFSLAVQPDGKIVVGGLFTQLGGQTRNYLGRLNADGSLDASFNPGANHYVESLAVQADGKIVVVGSGGLLRRLNADGTLDTGFNPEASSSVFSQALQLDGKILLGGTFTSLGAKRALTSLDSTPMAAWICPSIRVPPTG